MPALTFFTRDQLAPQRREFPDECEILVGRAPSPGATLEVRREGQRFTVLVPLDSLSERHARIVIADGVARVEDLHSRNGTMVRLSPGRPHPVGDAAIWLGPDLAVRAEDPRWALPERLAELSPEALRRLLDERLAPRGVRVELSSPAPDSLPIAGGEQHLCLRPRSAPGTVDLEDRGWVRFVVGAYNAARDEADAARSQSAWRFTAASPARRRALEQARRAARARLPVLITGPTGAGKDVLAQDLHEHGPARSGAFVAVNCAALSSERLESELFGHARGAYTGAHAERRGLVEEADGGTLFLDEVAEMPAAVQARLLRFLAEGGEYRRMGESRVRRSSARVLAATNRELPAPAGAPPFREDLYYRLAGVRIDVPAPGPADLEQIALSLLRTCAREHGRALPDSAALAVALDAGRRAWPGNARQLRFAVERCVQLFEPGGEWLNHWRECAGAPERGPAEDPVASASANPPPAARTSPAASPARVSKLVSDALFLTVARNARTRADLARALRVTYQGADARLAAMRVDLARPEEVSARLDECVAELRELTRGAPELQALLKTVLEG